jgi:hypothetical protein
MVPVWHVPECARPGDGCSESAVVGVHGGVVLCL